MGGTQHGPILKAREKAAGRRDNWNCKANPIIEQGGNEEYH